MRKGSESPYISRLMAVSGLVIEHGGDEDRAVALLHDALEDQPERTSMDELMCLSGERVAWQVWCELCHRCHPADGTARVTPAP